MILDVVKFRNSGQTPNMYTYSYLMLLLKS